MANPLMGTPSAARKVVIEKLCDVKVLPLYISFDAFMGESTYLADYVIPDTTQFENWGIPSSTGQIATKLSKVRWPVVEPMTMKLEDGRHACFENYVIDVCKAIGIPGFGERAIKDKDGNYHALNNPDDFFLRAVANVSYDGESVPDINNHEIELQGLQSELDKWKSILTPEELRKAAFVITRGGRFEKHDQGFIGEDAKYPSKGAIKFYMEATATARDSYTGEFYPGVLGWYPERFADGTLLTDKYSESEWPFRGANYKPKFRSVSMLANSKTFRDICKTNFIELNTKDAKKLGVKNGDKVKLTSPSGGKVTGNILVREGVCEGTVAVAFGYGHWEYGARKHQLGDKKIGGNKVIGNGVNLTVIAMMDPTVPATFGFSEMMTGVPSRNGGRYKIEKA
jgi:tetrathionate reductase subunit A